MDPFNKGHYSIQTALEARSDLRFEFLEKDEFIRTSGLFGKVAETELGPIKKSTELNSI